MPLLSYAPYSCWRARTGHHPLCVCGRSSSKRGGGSAAARRHAAASSDFAKFGGGVVLYFKYVKFASILYLLMAVLAVPSLVLFSLGGAYSSSGDGSSGTSLVGSLAVVTMGNLGEATPVCGSAYEAE